MDDEASIELPLDDAFSVETQLLHAAVERSLFGTEGAPVRLGRFVVVDRIGRGAAGVVYRAFDPELGRMVAIKVLAREGEAHAERTRLEAQILARLNHPNVVTVHEVGIDHGRLFVAMEFVDGTSLARWSEEHQVYDAARVRALIRMFEQAAQGLLAAHRAGIVHRDLKPSNILVDREGRVRIADFGLARIEGERTGEDQESTVGSGATSERLTSTGTVVGTPAYMAPEQFAGSADERSDQFGLCAAFFDAFHGVRPFAGRTASEVRESIEAGRLATPPRRGVPDRIARVLARGLATERSRRYENIEALTVALRRASSTHGRATKVAALGVVALIGGGLAVLDRAPQDPCVGSEERLNGVWDDDARARTESMIAGTGLAHAADTAGRTVHALDAYAERWRAGHRDACEATYVRHEQSAVLMDDRMACLHDIRRRFAALVDVLASGDAEVAGHALQAVEGLAPVEACADPIYVSAPIEEADPELRPRIEAVRDEIARAEALRVASRYRDGLSIAEKAASEAIDLAFAPLVGRALLERGRLEIATGAFDAADRSLRDALVASLRGRDDEGVFEVTLELTRLLGLHRENAEDGLWWADVARATAERLGEAGNAGVLTLSVAVGQLRERQGRDDDALEVYEEVLAQLRVEGRDGSQLFARVLGDVAAIHARRGDLESGLRESHEAARILEQVLGPDHYAMTFPLGNISNILVRMGRHDEALVQLERVLRLREDTLGPDHPGVADVVANLAVILTNLDRLDPAMQNMQRAIAIYEAALGGDHPKVAKCLSNLANVHLKRGEFEQTFAALERAAKIRETELGPMHPDLATSYRNIGNARLDHGEPEAATEAFDRALAIQEIALGPDHIDLASVLTGRGQAHLDLERYDDALADLERAAALREGKTLPPEQRAHMQLALARAVWKSGGDQTRAIALVQGASDLLASTTAPAQALRADVEKWLSEHAPPKR